MKVLRVFTEQPATRWEINSWFSTRKCHWRDRELRRGLKSLTKIKEAETELQATIKKNRVCLWCRQIQAWPASKINHPETKYLLWPQLAGRSVPQKSREWIHSFAQIRKISREKILAMRAVAGASKKRMVFRNLLKDTRASQIWRCHLNPKTVLLVNSISLTPIKKWSRWHLQISFRKIRIR